MTTHSVPTQMVRDARIDLALMERHADAMAATHEGGIYLRLLSETAEEALAWAQVHCTNLSGLEVVGTTAASPPVATSPDLIEEVG